jgi:predicted N-formylglutamate amidohydrolase
MNPVFRLVNPNGSAPIVLVCDHASNQIPAELNKLGLPERELTRHIALDIGAAGVCQLLVERLDAPAILCGTSRLVIDCNRHSHDARAIPIVSDGTRIPGNEGLSIEGRKARIDRYFKPYHDAIAELIDRRMASVGPIALLSIHSMTDTLGGQARPWQIALSSDADRRLTDPMLAALRSVPGIVVGDNLPYALDPEEDYSVPVHAIARGLKYLQVEFRQDEVAEAGGQRRWVARFADAFNAIGANWP